MIWRCWPSVTGFGFGPKRWGEFFISQVEEIDYKENAFNTLVLAEEKKDMILAAVSNSAQEFCDLVEGKGGGCVFLLHGPPGVGKTLTAEATAEHLHRPLYTLTSGELGTTPSQLEDSLSKVLQLALDFNAVLLIDECDIFLNARDGSDVTRNAMVGIFLRLLEYHKGILFLTTNRIDVFDAAVYSRISVALEYTSLSKKDREAVWCSLLEASGTKLDGIDVQALAELPANGRQIKNAVRLAKALGKGKASGVCTAGLIKAIEVAQDFSCSGVVPSGDKNCTQVLEMVRLTGTQSA